MNWENNTPSTDSLEIHLLFVPIMVKAYMGLKTESNWWVKVLLVDTRYLNRPKIPKMTSVKIT